MVKIVLLIRSYERPLYLLETIKSVNNSNALKICGKENMYIYDDCSNDPRVSKILELSGNYQKIISEKNLGCKKSYLEALKKLKEIYHKNDDDEIFICTLDNDVIVKPNFLEILSNEMIKAMQIFNTKNILFTGFNPTNAHKTLISDHSTFYTKKNFGAVNYFFHISFINFIIDSWGNYPDASVDHGVAIEMGKRGYKLCCLKKSVVNHVGKIGLYSNGTRYDTDENF